MPGVNTVEIPNRSLFRQPEVCEIAQVQPYVLRSWEAEFPDLGVSKIAGGPRVYRRADLERVLRLKHLLFVEGLTLAGARRKLQSEEPAETEGPALDELLGSDARERILEVKRGLREIAAMLAKAPGNGGHARQPAAKGRAKNLLDLADAPPPVKHASPHSAKHAPPPAKHPAKQLAKKKKAAGRKK